MINNLISVGVDWLTLVTDPEIASNQDVVTWLFESDNWSWQEGRPWRFFGYEGFIRDGVAYGTRNNSTLVQMRGSAAEDWFNDIPTYFRATRLDLQVTVLCTQKSELAQSAYNEGRGNKPYPQMRYTLLKSDSGGGGTCYVGSRTSLQYGRLYDKGDQLNMTGPNAVGHKVLWRYEVELKKDRADEVYQSLLHVRPDTYNYISQFVYSWWRERGVVPEFEPGGLNLEVIKAVQDSMFDDPLLRKLVWLKSSVSPVIEKLIKAGMADGVKEALDLDTLYNADLLADIDDPDEDG